MLDAGSTTLSKTNVLKLIIGGAAAFWATTVATSLLPIAAEYRAALTNWKIQTVWIDSLFAGLIIGCGVSYFVLRSLKRMRKKDLILESTKLGSIALIIVTVLVDVPRSLLAPGPSNAWSLYYFLVGLMFNAARFLLLGFAIGHLCKRLSAAA